ncbi:probable chitinase 10 [Anoplophora glabripennis]|uniref:probable chitinase 10 n=1 Tax=Anoplophora glabripennis TaxID=217634 RepID=UPI000873A815|nr:probable chitinase 10 [Anoplophora glabripennis]
MKHTVTFFVATTLLVAGTGAVDPWTPSPLCPFPSTDLVRFPYEGDCTKYWECYNGARYPMDCPTWLEFNSAESWCYTPSLANCDPDATIIYPTFSHSTVSTQSTAPTQDWGPKPKCPFPSNELIFFPVATNCAKYWECFQGIRYLMSCPPGLHWNTVYNYCDYPGNANCSINNATTTSSPVPTTPSTNTTTTPGGNTPDPQCPYPSDEITFYPHPTECNKYYECYQGHRYLMSCPSGLYWNEKENACDYRENVNCDRVSTLSPPTPVPTASTTANPICVGKPDGTYLANPNDCRKFYECVGGKAIEEQCAADLLWNDLILSCDYPQIVSCNTK